MRAPITFAFALPLCVLNANEWGLIVPLVEPTHTPAVAANWAATNPTAARP